MTDGAERDLLFEQFASLKLLGEQRYDDMYEARDQHDVDSCYRDAKDAFDDAIELAGRLGLVEEALALSERLGHIKQVYRSQFAG
jgi:hypothetical protein